MKLSANRLFLLSLLLSVTLFCTTAYRAGNPQSDFLYRDASQPIESRVNDLLKRMTLEEKLAQIQCIWQKKSQFIDKKGDLRPDSAAIYLKHGIGQIGRPSEGFDRSNNTGRTAEENARFTNQIQRFLVEKTRLKYLLFFMKNACTAMPQKMAPASRSRLALQVAGTANW